MARVHGATLLERTTVRGVRDVAGEIAVTTDGAEYRAQHLIVAAGPWSAHLLQQLDASIPLEVTKEQAMYFRPADPRPFEFGRFPIWIWMDDPSFYGFPVFGERGAIKVTQDAGGRAVDPDARDFEPDPQIAARVRGFLSRHLLQLDAPEHLTKTCLYTLTPDRDFVIDTLGEHPRVHVAIGAGHAFKFASLIGRILTELALDGATASDIAEFSIERPILRMESPPKTYMV
jgi:sarcosine oxidase